MRTRTIAAWAAAIALVTGAAAAQNGSQNIPTGDGHTAQDRRAQPLEPGGMGHGMMGQGDIRVEPGHGHDMMGPGHMPRAMPRYGSPDGTGQGGMHSGMMHGPQMHGGSMHASPMHRGAGHGRMMGHGSSGPTLQIELPSGLSFTCNAPMAVCLKALERVRRGARDAE